MYRIYHTLKIRKILGKSLCYAVLIFVLIFALFPVFYTLMSSFKSDKELLTAGNRIIPRTFVFSNYVKAWKMANFAQYTANSVFMSFFIVIGTVVTTTISGYVFARGRFPGKQFLFYMILSSMFVSLGSLTLYPLLMITKSMHLNKSLWGVIIIRMFGMNTTNLFITKGFIESIPKEIDEAAKIDGCSFFQIFIRIIAPLCKPVIATVGILSFRGSWNDYLLPLVFTLSNPDRMPLVVGVMNLKNSGEAASSWGLMFAGTTISILPMIIVYLCFNRYFIEGLTSGSVKG